MFEVGQVYSIGFVDHDYEGKLSVTWRPNCMAIEVKFPVVKFRQFDQEFIVNTSNPTFVGTEIR